MRTIIYFIFVISYFQLSGQYFGEQPIEKDELKTWHATTLKEYSRTYHFGFSEGECELRIFIYDTLFAAQRSCYTWRPTLNKFIDTFYTFNNVRIESNRFFSDETNGEFMTLTNATGSRAGLLLYKPWTYQFAEGGEFGSVLPDDSSVYLVGDFPQASKIVLTEKELIQYSARELQLMRNEIFARYGYRFSKGSAMATHFNKQKWYKANYDKVDQWLTSIELRNVETIKRLEKAKNGS